MDKYLNEITEYSISVTIKEKILAWEKDKNTSTLTESEKEKISDITLDYLSWAIDIGLLTSPSLLSPVIKRTISKLWDIV